MINHDTALDLLDLNVYLKQFYFFRAIQLLGLSLFGV
jgi:hypothetical protein